MSTRSFACTNAWGPLTIPYEKNSLLAAFLVLSLPAFAEDEKGNTCPPEADAEIDAVLDLDPNAPGKEVIGDKLGRLYAQCAAEPRDQSVGHQQVFD